MNPIAQIDPTGHYRSNIAGCVAACGILPQFAQGPNPSVADNMADNYQFFMGWHDAGQATVDEDGTFNYPEDPPLKPLAKIVGNQDVGEVVYIYPNAVVGVVIEGKLVKWTRMD